MSSSGLTVHMMTASFTPGDAIGNYMITSANIWRDWGAKVELYADYVAPELSGTARSSEMYTGTGYDILWYHYSIFADNIHLARSSPDLKIMDFHGIAPPDLFAGYNQHLQTACQKAIDLLPELAQDFDRYIVHSEYTKGVLLENGFEEKQINILPLCVDTDRYEGVDDVLLSELLNQIQYFLFVGRVVPQKDILSLLKIFAAINQRIPDSRLVIVGGRQLTPGYQRQIDKAVNHYGLKDKIIFTGQINNTAVLAALFRQAKFLLVTSEWESFCVPLVESMYFGTPVASHDIPPLPEVMGDGGLVVDKNEPAAAAESILALIMEKDAYRAKCEAALERAQQFTESSLRDALLFMLTKMTRGNDG